MSNSSSCLSVFVAIFSNKKSLPGIAALEGLLIPDAVAFSGQLELLRNNYDNRIVNDNNHKFTT